MKNANDSIHPDNPNNLTDLSETDEALFMRWRQNQDQAAFQTIDERYRPRLLALVARRMQQEESGMMIGAVVRRLMEHHPAVPFYTVHDSITTVEEHGDLVGRVLKEEYQRAGLHPTLKQTGDET